MSEEDDDDNHASLMLLGYAWWTTEQERIEREKKQKELEEGYILQQRSQSTGSLSDSGGDDVGAIIASSVLFGGAFTYFFPEVVFSALTLAGAGLTGYSTYALSEKLKCKGKLGNAFRYIAAAVTASALTTASYTWVPPVKRFVDHHLPDRIDAANDGYIFEVPVFIGDTYYRREHGTALLRDQNSENDVWGRIMELPPGTFLLAMRDSLKQEKKNDRLMKVKLLFRKTPDSSVEEINGYVANQEDNKRIAHKGNITSEMISEAADANFRKLTSKLTNTPLFFNYKYVKRFASWPEEPEETATTAANSASTDQEIYQHFRASCPQHEGQYKRAFRCCLQSGIA